MARYLDTDEMTETLQSGSRSGGASLKDAFVDLKPGSTGQVVRKLRLVGLPLGYKEHQSKIRDKQDPKKQNSVPFPDADQNKAYTRVCTEGDPAYGECVWCRLGYVTSQKYSINCIDRETGQVKILNKGKMVFTDFAEWEKENRTINAENIAAGEQEDLLWEKIGGEVAPDVRITARTDAGTIGGVKYTITPAPKTNTLTEAEIEALAAIGKPTAEERKKRVEADPKMRTYPEWFMYGYKLDEIHKPSMLRTPVAPTTEADMDMTTLPSAPAAAAPKATAKPAPATQAQDEDETESTDGLPNW